MIDIVECYFILSANRNSLPELSSAQTVKLRHLTIVSLASESKVMMLLWYDGVGLYGMVCYAIYSMMVIGMLHMHQNIWYFISLL